MTSGGKRNPAKGKRAEWKVRDVRRGEGYFVVRAGGSLGPADFVALKAGEHPELIQVKGTAAGPYARFPPAERAELRRVARQAGASAVLAWWPPGGKLEWIDEESWPS